MIEEILTLRRKGLSFRKIAEELNTTIGKVQYQWRKYKKEQEQADTENNKQNTDIEKPELLPILEQAIWGRKKYVHVSCLSRWITGGEHLFPYWSLIDVRRKPVYLLQDYKQYPRAIRLLDVTYYPVAINNIRIVKEAVLESGQEALARRLFQPNCSYMLELGIKLSKNNFTPLFRSNVVHIKEDTP